MTQSGHERFIRKKKKACSVSEADEGTIDMALLLIVGKKNSNMFFFQHGHLWSIAFQTAADVCLSSSVVYAAHSVQEDTREKLAQRPVSKKTYAELCARVWGFVCWGVWLHVHVFHRYIIISHYVATSERLAESLQLPLLKEKKKAVGVAPLSPWNCIWNPFTETRDWG